MFAGIVPIGVYENATPLHTAVTSFCDPMVAAGFTVTLTVNAVPAQLPDGEVGVTLYTAVAATDVVLIRLSCNIT